MRKPNWYDIIGPLTSDMSGNDLELKVVAFRCLCLLPSKYASEILENNEADF